MIHGSCNKDLYGPKDHATKIHTGKQRKRLLQLAPNRTYSSPYSYEIGNLRHILRNTVPGRRMEVCNSQSIDNIKKLHELKMLPAADAGGASV